MNIRSLDISSCIHVKTVINIGKLYLILNVEIVVLMQPHVIKDNTSFACHTYCDCDATNTDIFVNSESVVLILYIDCFGFITFTPKFRLLCFVPSNV